MSENYTPELKDYYPYVTRSLIRLFNQHMLPNVVSIDVEPKYGYVSRLSYTNGDHRVTYGNDLGLNAGAAEDLARDKGHTKFMLRAMGINSPAGEEFLLPWWADSIRDVQESRGNDDILTTEMAEDYIGSHGNYPVYVKPVSGSKGADIYKAHNVQELHDAFDVYEQKRVRVAMVEEPITMPDYRVVTLDGELISAYQRVPLTVIGDGKRTIRELMEVRQNEFNLLGRDTDLQKVTIQVERFISRHDMTLDSVIEDGTELPLVPISNLSAGGTSVDVSDKIHPRWGELAARVAHNFNLRLSGLDLACQDITDPNSDYSVLEVNSTPGLDHYALSGDAQRELVDSLYIKVLNAFPKVDS